MRYRKFGSSDLEVSEICFGPMRFTAKEPTQDEASVAGQRALSRALDRGVNFIHSSHGYGTSWAIREVLRNHPKRHEVHHIIKVGVPDFDDGGRFDAAKFRLLIEESLEDLGAERIAVVQHLHRARPNSDELRIANIPATFEPLMEIFEHMRLYWFSVNWNLPSHWLV